MNYIHTSEQDELLESLQKDGFKYFIDKVNPDNGFISDSTCDHDTCSIAAVGFALACYLVGVAHGWVSHQAVTTRYPAPLEPPPEAPALPAPPSPPAPDESEAAITATIAPKLDSLPVIPWNQTGKGTLPSS